VGRRGVVAAAGLAPAPPRIRGGTVVGRRGVLAAAGLAAGLAACAGPPPEPGEPGYAREETRQAVVLALEPEPDERLTLLLLGAERRLTRLEHAFAARDRTLVLALADAYRIVIEDGVRARLEDDPAPSEDRRDVRDVLTDHLARLVRLRRAAEAGLLAAALDEVSAAARRVRDRVRPERR